MLGCFILIAAGLAHEPPPRATAGDTLGSDSRMQVARVPLHTVLFFLLFFYFFYTRAPGFVKEQEFLRERGREARRKVDL